MAQREHASKNLNCTRSPPSDSSTAPATGIRPAAAPAGVTALRAAAVAEGYGRPVHLRDPLQEAPARIHHRPPQLPERRPGASVAADPRLRLKPGRRDAVGARRHDVDGQEPRPERQVAAVRHRAHRHRSLPSAPRAPVEAAPAPRDLPPEGKGEDGSRLVVTHSPRRVRKDAYDRTRRIEKLRGKLEKGATPAAPSPSGAARFLDFPDGHVAVNGDRIARAAAWGPGRAPAQPERPERPQHGWPWGSALRMATVTPPRNSALDLNGYGRFCWLC